MLLAQFVRDLEQGTLDEGFMRLDEDDRPWCDVSKPGFRINRHVEQEATVAGLNQALSRY